MVIQVVLSMYITRPVSERILRGWLRYVTYSGIPYVSFDVLVMHILDLKDIRVSVEPSLVFT